MVDLLKMYPEFQKAQRDPEDTAERIRRLMVSIKKAETGGAL